MKNLFLFLVLLPFCSWAQNQTVTLTSITPTILCAGSSFTVTYTSTGDRFRGGAAIALIDGNGNDIATGGSDDNAGDSGTLIGTIPFTMSNGSPLPPGNYTARIRRGAFFSDNTLRTVYSNSSPALTLNTPLSPITKDVLYCLNDGAVSLANSVTATGTLNWYSSQTGGTASVQTPTPPTSQTGSAIYYVSQTQNGCEGLRASVSIRVIDCSIVTNTFLGTSAGAANTTGRSNTLLGYQAGFTNTTGGTNVFVGPQTGYTNTIGSSNVFIGDRAGYLNTGGSSNTFIGNLAGYNNINGQANMFLGPQAGSNSTTGNYNVFLGNAAANANTTGSDNTAIGAGSAAQNTTGQRNTFLGEYAGFNSQSGNENVFIGFGTKAGTTNPTNLNNAVAIGANAIVSQDNSVILGNSISSVGIGNSAPKNKLEITQGTANQSGLRLTNLTSASPASLTNQSKFLTVNDQGDVILASLNGSGRVGVSESLWERKGSFLQSLQGEAIIIGSKVAQTPAGYKLFVEDGILTEKVKVAVKNTAEWSDKVFAPSYSLRPLSEVALYINKHQHLPGIPSAKEMVQQGNDLHKTDAKLLEKIEELTLYSIQLEKQLDASNERQREKDKKQQVEIDELKQLVKQLLEKK